MEQKNMLSVKVTRKQLEAEGIVSLELMRADGGALPRFSAGAHIDVEIKPGLVRQYSLCNHPEESHRYLIAVLRDPASTGGSIAIHDEIQQGDPIRISAPKNHFPLVRARRHLLFGGGIGITPVLCMAERLAHSGADFELHYCARSPSRAAFVDRIQASDYAGRVHYHFDDGKADQLLDLDELLEVPDGSTHIYVCGPTAFIEYVCNAAQTHGWGTGNVHFEFFGAPAQNTAGDTAFEVEIASSGEVITIPAGQTVTQVLARNGVDIEVACEKGVCGTCVTRILQGTPDHRDVFLSADDKAKNDQFTPCCSRAKSPSLVLDI